jgi:putative inorganic carbon (HCO3(-)) transporter
MPERLAFNHGAGTVPSRGPIEASPANEVEPAFATAAYAGARDWGYLGLLAFTAMLMLRPQDQISGLRSLHLAEICAVTGIAAMILHQLARRRPVFRLTPETSGLALFGFAILATAPFSVWPGGVLQVFTESYLKIAVVFILMMNTLTTPRRLDQITWLILLCCGYISALALFNYARGTHLVENGRLAGPVSGIFGNPNDLALNMVTFLPAAIIVAMTRRHGIARRLAAAVVAALMFATVVFTQSRGGMIGLAAALLALVLLGRSVRPGFGVIAVAAVIVAMPFAPTSFWARMSSILDEQQDRVQFTGSRETRWIVMQEGIDAFVDRPFTGVGAGQFKNYNPPERRERWRETHNALIQVAAETGIFGLLAFSFLIVRAAIAAASTRRMLRRPRRASAPDPLHHVLSDGDRQVLSSHAVAMIAGLAGWFVCSLFASVAYNWTFYYLLALIVAGRQLVFERLAASRAFRTDSGKPLAVSRSGFSRRLAPGHA